MGKTIAEKILAKAAGRSEVSIGEYLEVSSNRPVTQNSNLLKGVGQMKAMGFNRVFNPKLINIVDGHYGITASHQARERGRYIEKWAKEVGIPEENIYILGRSGIEHVLAGENCFALPGDCFFQVLNGHTITLGALGAFAITLSYGSGGYLMTGKTWIRVPESTKINISGDLSMGVTARDVSEYILRQIGPIGCSGQVMEFAGPTIDNMEMDGRFTLCCNALFASASTAIINPDQKTLDYVTERTQDPFDPLVSDWNATYLKTLNFDVSGLIPQIVPPPDRYVVKPVTEFEGTPITNGFIGSCANSRLEDIRIAAKILKGKKIHPGIILNITPGTPNIYKQALIEGLIETLLDAQVVIPYPACGMCMGYNTPLAKGDVCISTGTCNYPGRMGSKDADIYLANPGTVAASCIEGKIADPRKYL